MARCASCDSEISGETTEYCPACAADSGSEFTCARCGEEYQNGDACPSCGHLRIPTNCDEHPDRAAEGRCVICGRAACGDCWTDPANRACLCVEHRTVTIIEGWAQIYSTASEVEAGLVRENLLAEGVDAQVYSQKDSIFTVDLGELSIVRVLVPVWEYAGALQLIRGHMDVDGEVAFACPSCGEAYDGGTRECIACGAALV